MNLEWDVDFFLIPSVNAADTTPGLPPLDLNVPVSIGTMPLGIFLLDPSKCSSGSARRITRNNLSQADGEITHRKFKSGHVMELNVGLWETPYDPACAGVLRVMADLIGEYLEAMANNDGQVVWFPSPWPADAPAPNPRVLDRARSMGPSGNDATGASFVSVVTEKDENAKLWVVTFAFLSPFPYVTDYMNWPSSPDEIVTFATDPVPPLHGGPAADACVTITNEGNVMMQPIIRIHGPATECTITNFSVTDEIGEPLQIRYINDAGHPGSLPIPSGSYLEIDTFTSRVQLINPGGTDNGRASIDVLRTDWFGLAPGDNHLCVDKELSLDVDFYDGDGVDIVYRNAWA